MNSVYKKYRPRVKRLLNQQLDVTDLFLLFSWLVNEY